MLFWHFYVTFLKPKKLGEFNILLKSNTVGHPGDKSLQSRDSTGLYNSEKRK